VKSRTQGVQVAKQEKESYGCWKEKLSIRSAREIILSTEGKRDVKIEEKRQTVRNVLC